MKTNISYKKYDKADTVAVVSLYPKRGEMYSKGTTGVASYTKNLITKLTHKAVVFANVIDSPDTYKEKNKLVVRCFTPNTISMWSTLLIELKKFSNIKKLLIQLDFSMYGSMLVSGLVIPFLGICKIMGYETTVVLHHVITNVNHLSGHVGLTHSPFDQMKARIYNALFATFNISLGLVSKQIVILEHGLYEKLATVIPKEKITVIPHAVDTHTRLIDKTYARKRLQLPKNDYVVMFFGYVNWFKGADLFARYFERKQKIGGRRVRFILAGGESPTMKQKLFYQNYFCDVRNRIHASKNISMTDYVDQKDIGAYFSAADLVVFPYRDFMCASGVMSLTFSYQRPFIVSDKLSAMFDAADFTQAFERVGLTKEDMVFRLTRTDILHQTTNVLTDGVKPKLVKLSKMIAQERSFEKTATLYEDALFAPTTSISGSLALKTSRAYGK